MTMNLKFCLEKHVFPELVETLDTYSAARRTLQEAERELLKAVEESAPGKLLRALCRDHRVCLRIVHQPHTDHPFVTIPDYQVNKEYSAGKVMPPYYGMDPKLVTSLLHSKFLTDDEKRELVGYTANKVPNMKFRVVADSTEKLPPGRYAVRAEESDDE